MIDLSWNTKGRLARRPYRRLRWTLGLIPMLPILALFVSFAIFATFEHPVVLALIGITGLTVIYVQYRYLQAMIRRLHDRNLSGLTLLPLALISWTGFFLAITVLSNATAPEAALARNPLVGWAFEPNNQWIGVALFVPFLLYGLFVGINLFLDGAPLPNRYGPAPDNR